MKQTKADYLVTVETVPGTWANFTGGGGSAEVTRDYDGGAERADLLAGKVEWEDIEVVRTIDQVRDEGWMLKLRKSIGRGRYNLMKQALSPDGVRIGRPESYPNCLLTGYKSAEVESSSSDAAQVTLTFATSGPA